MSSTSVRDRAADGWTLEVLLGGLTAIAPLSIDMYLAAMPAIAADLDVGIDAAQQTLPAFFAGFAIGQLVAGPVLDRLGRRGPLLASLALFVAGSIGCALAPSLEMLLVCRFLQALGGSTAVVVPRAVVRDVRSGVEIARTMSRLMLVMGVAPIVAPLLGGYVQAAWGWRAIFVVLAGSGLVALGAAARLLPDTRPLAATPGGVSSVGPWRALARDVRQLVREPDFVRFAICGGLVSAGMFAYIAGSSFVLIEVHHVPAVRYGWYFGANALGLIAASQLNRWLLGRASAARILRWSTTWVAIAGLGVLVATWTGIGGLPGLAASLFAFVASIGLIGPNTTALALEHHASRAGLASAVLGAAGFTIAALASSAVGALHDGTARPMGAVMAFAGAAAWTVGRVGRPAPLARATAAGAS